MTTAEIANLDDFELLVKAPARGITSVYCADLLSWAMSHAPEGCAWCTVMGNVNTVAVATLADAAAIVLCEGAQLADDARTKAEERGVCIAATHLPAFEAGLALARSAGLL